MATNTAETSGVIIMAAGQGTRMRSSLPKVLHEIGGKPLLLHVISAVNRVAPGAPIAVIVGKGREKVEAMVKASAEYSLTEITFVHQAEQKGTGHAARCAMDSPWGEARAKARGAVLVLPGDLPLVTDELVRQMIAPLGRGEAMRLLTCELADPTGYGRIVRRGKTGPVLRIAEQKDATVREKEIREVGTSIYLFQAPLLKTGLHRLSSKNAQGEYYLTDMIGQAASARKKIDVLKWTAPEDVRGVNDPWELAEARGLLNRRIVRKWALEGVQFIDPGTNWIDSDVELAAEVVVHPGATLSGRTRVRAGAFLGAHIQLKNMEIGERATVKTGTVGEDSAIEAEASVGPYAHLRPGSVVGRGAKVGNFVELKKATVGEKTSVAHLSYLGDATVGAGVNIGCGFVTCNFDGRIINGERKHKTVIEDGAFIGSDCQVVAPIRIGKGAYVASGSTITEDVPADALAIARSRQTNKPGYARKLRSEK